MGDSLIYSNVATELIEIFNYLDENIYKKIPEKVIDNLFKIRNKEYKFTIDKEKTLDEQNLLTETKQILSILFLKYCCTKEEADEILELNNERIVAEEKERRIKYDPNNIFNKKHENTIQSQATQLVVIKEEKFYSKIWDKIKNVFEKFFGKRDK